MQTLSFEKFLEEKGITKDKKYVIAGFSKCGTTSMQQYFDANGYDCIKRDAWIFNPVTAKEQDEVKDRYIVLMFRDPIERAWSHYWYLFRKKTHDVTEQHIKNIRWEECCSKSIYHNYLSKYPNYIELIHEEVIKFEEFPVDNVNTMKEPLTDEMRIKIKQTMDRLDKFKSK